MEVSDHHLMLLFGSILHQDFVFLRPLRHFPRGAAIALKFGTNRTTPWAYNSFCL